MNHRINFDWHLANFLRQKPKKKRHSYYSRRITISIFIFLCFSFLWLSFPAQAETFYFGFSTGPAIGFNSDFNNQNKKSTLHYNIGFDILYGLNCHRGSFCKDSFFEVSFDYLFPATYNFGSTAVPATGITGNFSERTEYYSGVFSFRKILLSHSKLTPFVSAGVGLSYVKLSNSRYTDSLGTPLNLDVSGNSLNFNISPAVGLTYKISHRLEVDVLARFTMLIPSFLNNSFLEIPLGIRYRF